MMPRKWLQRYLASQAFYIIILSVLSVLIDFVAFQFSAGWFTLPSISWVVREFEYAPAFFAIIFGTAELLAVRSKKIAVPLALYHFAALACLFCFMTIQGRGPLPADMEIIADGMGNIVFLPVETLVFFRWRIFPALAFALIAVFSLNAIGRRMAAASPKRISPAIAVAAYIAGCIYFLQPLRISDISLSPIYARVPLLGVSWLVRENNLYRGARDKPLPLALDASSSPRHIVYIMDESVSGKLLQINGSTLPTTPFMHSVRDQFHNYGQACSAANLSKTSNIMAVSGLRFDQIPDHEQLSLRQASIFGYAAQAGRKTYYLDSQKTSAYNFMMPRDRLNYAYVTPPNDKTFYNRDMLAIETLREILDDADSPTFTYLLKSGCHFGYDSKSPPGFAPELKDQGNVPASYQRAVLWNVDEFFRRFSQELEGRDILVVYTSDHGQCLDGSGLAPHARIHNTSPDEANVPLVIWPMSAASREYFDKMGGFREEQFDRSWHFQVFPTILILMGYAHDDVVAAFGDSFFDSAPQRRFFLSGFLFDEFGSEHGFYELNAFD